jgi:hypothetical protein
VNGQVFENVLFVALYDKSKAVVGLATVTARAPVLSHKRTVASKRFTYPILASESKIVFNFITA